MRFLLERGRKSRGFTLAEAVIGIGMAAVLILSIIAISTAALSGDQKVEMREVALAVADAEINRFAKQVGMANSTSRTAFWAMPVDGLYAGPGTQASVNTNKTDFELIYSFQTIDNQLEPPDTTLGHERPGNRIRKVNLTVSWWNGEQGKPGYGQLAVKTTRLIRESDIRDNS